MNNDERMRALYRKVGSNSIPLIEDMLAEKLEIGSTPPSPSTNESTPPAPSSK